MGRHTGPKCKLCRREGVKLFLKGARCHTAKCPIEKRSKPPGMHGWRRGRPSDYAIRLREKQKCKRYYGVLEAQFRRYFEHATRARGNTGENLLALLERRLDNVLTVCGFAVSRAQARQFVSHRHVQVNGRMVDVPNYLVEEGDVIRPEPKDAMLELVRGHREETGHPDPGWMEVNDADLTARAVRSPVREDVTVEVQDGLIVELCSR
ncbi:MAG: 30S ribosomal protein S4 [Planctomycetota bacterium]